MKATELRRTRFFGNALVKHNGKWIIYYGCADNRIAPFRLIVPPAARCDACPRAARSLKSDGKTDRR